MTSDNMPVTSTHQSMLLRLVRPDIMRLTTSRLLTPSEINPWAASRDRGHSLQPRPHHTKHWTWETELRRIQVAFYHLVMSWYLHEGITFSDAKLVMVFPCPLVQAQPTLATSALVDSDVCRNVMTLKDKWHVDTQFPLSTRALSIHPNCICLMTHIMTCHDV